MTSGDPFNPSAGLVKSLASWQNINDFEWHLTIRAMGKGEFRLTRTPGYRASEGIPSGLSLQLAAAGYTVTVVARNAARLAELLKVLGDGGHRALAADLATPAGIGSVVAALQGKPAFELLINNAGAGKYGTFRGMDGDDLGAMIRLNCEALTALALAFLRQAAPGDPGERRLGRRLFSGAGTGRLCGDQSLRGIPVDGPVGRGTPARRPGPGRLSWDDDQRVPSARGW